MICTFAIQFLRRHLPFREMNWLCGVLLLNNTWLKANVISFLFQYLSRFSLVPVFTEEDFQHWFLPREDIIDTYVVDKPDSSSPTGIGTVALWIIPQKILSYLSILLMFYRPQDHRPGVVLHTSLDGDEPSHPQQSEGCLQFLQCGHIGIMGRPHRGCPSPRQKGKSTVIWTKDSLVFFWFSENGL